MRLQRALALLFCATALAACEKTAVQDLTGPMPSARIKFYNFSVGAPGVNFYANDTKMTAIASGTGTEATTGVNYSGVAAGDRYTAIEPGQYTFSGRIAAATDKDLPISNVTATIADGKFYSFYQSGIYDAANKQADGFIVEDNFPSGIDWTQAHLRFVHAMANTNPMTLYVTNIETGVETAVGGEVTYKSGGAFVGLPPGTYNLSARYAGSDTTSVIVRANVGLAPGRVYTIGARGNITATTGSVPFLDLTINRQS